MNIFEASSSSNGGGNDGGGIVPSRNNCSVSGRERRQCQEVRERTSAGAQKGSELEEGRKRVGGLKEVGAE